MAASDLMECCCVYCGRDFILWHLAQHEGACPQKEIVEAKWARAKARHTEWLSRQSTGV